MHSNAMHCDPVPTVLVNDEDSAPLSCWNACRDPVDGVAATAAAPAAGDLILPSVTAMQLRVRQSSPHPAMEPAHSIKDRSDRDHARSFCVRGDFVRKEISPSLGVGGFLGRRALKRRDILGIYSGFVLSKEVYNSLEQTRGWIAHYAFRHPSGFYVVGRPDIDKLAAINEPSDGNPPNLAFEWVDCHCLGNAPVLTLAVFVALRDIQPHEQVTVNYGSEFVRIDANGRPYDPPIHHDELPAGVLQDDVITFINSQGGSMECVLRNFGIPDAPQNETASQDEWRERDDRICRSLLPIRKPSTSTEPVGLSMTPTTHAITWRSQRNQSAGSPPPTTPFCSTPWADAPHVGGPAVKVWR